MKAQRKINIILLLLFCFIGLSSCGSQQKVSIEIVPQIEKYSPVMSSVIGFPLKVKFNDDTSKYKDYIYHWRADNGTFMGSELSNKKEDGTLNDRKTKSDIIYWSPPLDGTLTSKTTKLIVEIENGNGKVLGTDSIELVTDDKLNTTVKK